MKLRPIHLLISIAGIGGAGIFGWPLIAARFTGFSEYAATVEDDYAKIEAAGFPLDAKSFAASFAVPETENNGEPLRREFIRLDRFVSELNKASPNKNNSEYPSPQSILTRTNFSYYKRNAPTLEERLQLFSMARPYIDRIISKSAKPHYIIRSNWQEMDEDYRDISGLLLAAKCLIAEGVLFAQQGKRELSIKNFRLAARLCSLIGTKNSDYHYEYQTVVAKTFAESIIDCALLDPEGAPLYKSILKEIEFCPDGRLVHFEAFRLAALLRENSTSNLYQTLARIHEYEPNTSIPQRVLTPPSDRDLPTDPFARPMLAFSLRQYAPVLKSVSPDGAVSDQVEFHAESSRFIAAVQAEMGPIGFFHGRLAGNFTYQIERRNKTKNLLELADSVMTVLQFRLKNRRWPDSLSSAGVHSAHPAKVGYRKRGPNVHIWSIDAVGENGTGVTRYSKYERIELELAPQVNPHEVRLYPVK